MSIPTNVPSHAVPLGDLPAQALDGVRTRRMLAILFDLIFVTIIVAVAFMLLLVLGVVTFGLSWLAIPFLYPSSRFSTTARRFPARTWRRPACG